MARLALTDRFIAGARAADGERLDFFDEKTSGLALRVSQDSKAWTFHFTSPTDSKRIRMKLGSYPGTSLAAARTLATQARGYLDEKPPRDPRIVFAEQKAGGMLVKALVESYLSKHVDPNLRTAKAVRRRFNKNVVPVIGDVKVAELHRRDVNRCVDPILARGKPIEASRCFEDIRGMLRWGTARGDLDHNPIDGMKKPATSTPRERVLSDDEIRQLWASLPEALAKSVASQRIIKLCLVTGQRIGEVAGMQPGELNFKAETWSLPGARTKNGCPHEVPLSALAVSLIKEATKEAGDDTKYVFPDLDGEGPLSPHAVAKTITRAQKAEKERPRGRFGMVHWTAHDLRRTAATGMARLGVAPIVLGHVFNHRTTTKAGVTLAVYAHYDYAKEKRQALELWADRVTALTSSPKTAEVVPIGKKRKAKK